MKLKEKNQPHKNIVAETFYLYTEQSQPKKKRSLLPLWIILAVVIATAGFLIIPRTRNLAMKILPPDVHYRLLEWQYVNSFNKNGALLPSEYVFSISGTAHSDLLKNLLEKSYKLENPLNTASVNESATAFLKNPNGTISRSTDGGSTAFAVTFSENSALFGTEMEVVSDADGKLIKRTFTADNAVIEWQDISEKGKLDYSFRYENADEIFTLSVNGSEAENGYTGAGMIEYLGSTTEISFENFKADGALNGIFKLMPQSGSDVSAEMTLNGTPEKPAAEISFFDGGEKLISYTISSDNAENPAELTFPQISDALKKLMAVEKFIPYEQNGEPAHTCDRSVDLTMSKIKIGKKYIGLPAALENLPELFELEGETIQSGREKMFVTDNREIVIVLKNYNEKPEDAMKCDVTQIIVNGYAGRALWELKLNDIGIGNTQYQTVSVLGKPSRIETIDDSEVYCYHDCENDIEFKFKYKNGVIVQIIFAV